MEYWVYASCTGSIYVCDEPQVLETCPMCGDEDDYLGRCDTREEVAELIYTEGYNAFAVYKATGLLPELKLRKPTEEEVEEMRRQGYRYYGRFEKEGKGKTNE